MKASFESPVPPLEEEDIEAKVNIVFENMIKAKQACDHAMVKLISQCNSVVVCVYNSYALYCSKHYMYIAESVLLSHSLSYDVAT